jgi:hypothetical protein
MLVEQATAHVQQGEIGEGCRLAGEALTIATGQRSEKALQRIRSFRRQLQRWEQTSQVRDLDDRLSMNRHAPVTRGRVRS